MQNTTYGRWAGISALYLGLVMNSCAQEPKAPAAPVQPEPLTGPWVVAVQPGHWKSDELPDELRRLRGSSGTAWGQTREVDINRVVADELVKLIQARGWTALLLPATVPPGLRADVFLSIHADGSSDTSRHGWKLAPPWRSSPAGLSLAASLESAFSSQSDLVHDAEGITVNMRGYFAFSPRRFEHAVSPFTPSALVELGFLSNAADRRLLTGDPRRFASILMSGLESYLTSRPRARVDDLAPREFPRMVVGLKGVEVRSRSMEGSRFLGRLPAGTLLSPVGESGEWYEVSVRSLRLIGWVSKDGLLSADPVLSVF